VAAAAVAAASLRQQLASNPFWQAEQGASAGGGNQDGSANGKGEGEGGDGKEEGSSHLAQLRRKAELLEEAEGIRRRMRASQLTR